MHPSNQLTNGYTKLTGTPPAIVIHVSYVSNEGSNNITSSPGLITEKIKHESLIESSKTSSQR